MTDKSTEKAQQTTRDATAEAGAAVEKAANMARRTGERASDGYEELSVLGRDNMEDMATATGVMLKGASDLGSAWMSFWHGQLIDSMAALRSLAGSRSWQEALTVQSDFAAASVQRISSLATESAEVTRDIASDTFRPLQERVQTAARFPRMAA